VGVVAGGSMMRLAREGQRKNTCPRKTSGSLLAQWLQGSLRGAGFPSSPECAACGAYRRGLQAERWGADAEAVAWRRGASASSAAATVLAVAHAL
jgi:hypothetical protein